MINVLLDPLPEEWEAEDGTTWPINTDFRIGIQLTLLYADQDATEQEKLVVMRSLLGLSGTQIGPEDLIECVKWFLGGWSHDNPSKEKGERLTDFDIDQWRIYSAFRQQYGINLSEVEYLHYWEFMGLLTSLTETAYTRVVEIRGRKVTTNMFKEDRKALMKAKETYRLGKLMTVEEKELEDEVFGILGGRPDAEEERRIREFEKYGEVEDKGDL